jgi:hypothetical protein
MLRYVQCWRISKLLSAKEIKAIKASFHKLCCFSIWSNSIITFEKLHFCLPLGNGGTQRLGPAIYSSRYFESKNVVKCSQYVFLPNCFFSTFFCLFLWNTRTRRFPSQLDSHRRVVRQGNFGIFVPIGSCSQQTSQISDTLASSDHWW